MVKVWSFVIICSIFRIVAWNLANIDLGIICGLVLYIKLTKLNILGMHCAYWPNNWSIVTLFN